MIAAHLSEEEIQQYALDKKGSAPHLIAHMETCVDCQAKLQTYTQLFEAIRVQEKPTFDFDLSGLLMPQLAKPKFAFNDFLVYFTVFLMGSSTIVAAFAFRKYLANIFTGVMPMFIYLILLTGLAVIVFQAAELFRKYQKQISALN
ncbi:MAG: hypothetical protein JST58_09725 [Bacteroidetes bacterium]|nr:hypothetical protein [Bacteroidota bacterium]